MCHLLMLQMHSASLSAVCLYGYLPGASTALLLLYDPLRYELSLDGLAEATYTSFLYSRPERPESET